MNHKKTFIILVILFVILFSLSGKGIVLPEEVDLEKPVGSIEMVSPYKFIDEQGTEFRYLENSFIGIINPSFLHTLTLSPLNSHLFTRYHTLNLYFQACLTFGITLMLSSVSTTVVSVMYFAIPAAMNFMTGVILAATAGSIFLLFGLPGVIVAAILFKIMKTVFKRMIDNYNGDQDEFSGLYDDKVMTAAFSFAL